VSDDDIVLVWLKNSSEKYWYRVFIDGAYCGVDQYQFDMSDNDLD
jgi:hypothetical protein